VESRRGRARGRRLGHPKARDYLETALAVPRLMIRYVVQPEELDSPADSALGVRSRKLSNALNGQSWDG
jgi:hypothetical protein